MADEKKRNIYMLQVNYPYGNTAHLPYTAAALMSYAMNDEAVSSRFELKDIFFLREPPEQLIEKIEDPSVVGFSSYIWNFEYNKYIARRIKERFPDCVTVFGGHHVTPGGGLLEECPYIDYLIHGEGEEAFRRLLLCTAGIGCVEDIGGISYRGARGVVTTPGSPLGTGDTIDYPSPYLTGYFDKILAENKDKVFMALIETTRGCPNSCTYCDWSNMKSRIRKFPLERVFSEIRWISEHRIFGMGSADSNFGIFERDEQITDYIIEMYLKNGFPKGYQTSYAKNSNDRIFRIGCALEKYSLSKGITLSFQSMSDEVLANIGRKNISVEHYKELMEMYNAAGISTYTELILGLPGETRQSFSEGIDRLLCLGQHNSIYIHNCEWLPCSVMASPDYVEKYKIRTSRIPLNQPHIEGAIPDGITEYSNLITSTYSMTDRDWISMNLFSFTVQCFHHLGLFQLFSLFLHNEYGVGYSDFYERTLRWLQSSDNSAAKAVATVEKRLKDIADGVPGTEFVIADDRFGTVRWPFEEYIFLCTVWDLDAFYEDAKTFLSGFFDDGVLFDELLRFQRAMIKRPFYGGGTVVSEYDFESYFINTLKNKRVPLVRKKHEMKIDARYFDDWVEYAKIVAWFGRKDNRSIYLEERADRNDSK
ncbi:MAG: cobalamin-dependent protein [Clostridia bacterium]|nr:cobalamin-dependent protein [Clostridia bacterium]